MRTDLCQWPAIDEIAVSALQAVRHPVIDSGWSRRMDGLMTEVPGTAAAGKERWASTVRIPATSTRRQVGLGAPLILCLGKRIVGT